jgi:hypothetical protein
MVVYELELKMDPVHPVSCTLTLVEDVGSFAAGNLCHFSSTNPNMQDHIEYATCFLAQQLRPNLFA